MKIYAFEKNYCERLSDISVVLEDENAYSVRDQWKEFLETSIEPAGYKCIWKINRAICEKLNIPHGSEVFGEVISTDFNELTVEMRIEGVKNEEIQLPETLTTPLLSIYPTIYQENVVNADITADILDRYRFFYNYIFLPFDNDTEKNWTQKNLIARIQFIFDLNNGKTMSKCMTSYIRQLIEEAKYIQDKRELLENSMEDGDESLDNLDLSQDHSKEAAAKLLELYLRMNKIKNEIELLSNPEMREVYETLKFPSKSGSAVGEKKIFVVNKEGTINDQIQLLENLRAKIDSHDKIHWMQCLNNAIEHAGNLSQIYIPPGVHSLKFLEYLDESILISGVNNFPIENMCLEKLDSYAVIRANELSSMLFAISGDIKFQNVAIDCRNVNTGFIIKSGNVSFDNCFIFGLKSTSIAEAFNISGNCKVFVENSVISNFGTAIDFKGSELVLKQTIIKECGIGVVVSDDAAILMKDSKILNVKDAIMKFTKHEDKEQKSLLSLDDRVELEKLKLMINGSKIDGPIKIISKLAEDSIIEMNNESDLME